MPHATATVVSAGFYGCVGSLLAVLCWGHSASSAHGQSRGEPPGASVGAQRQHAPLPPMADWFLSTGKWHEDPQLYVREIGTGSDIVVMLHGGWGGEHSGLVDAVKGLTDRYRFVLYDQRGSLRSPAPDASITFDRHIEDLELLRQELGVERLNLVAHSMGAVLASAYASRYPERIVRLTLLAPGPLKNPIPDEDRALQQEAAAAFQAFLHRPEVQQELRTYGLDRTEPPLSSREETSKFRIDLYKRMLYDIAKWPLLMGGRSLYKGHVDALTARTYPASGWDYLAEFAARPYPVGIVVGDHDFIDFGNRLVEKWVAGVPTIVLTVVRDAGHLLWVDQPEAVTDALQAHLSGQATRTGGVEGR